MQNSGQTLVLVVEDSKFVGVAHAHRTSRDTS